jgi:RNA polymerase sigma factor (sigma-70 family)
MKREASSKMQHLTDEDVMLLLQSGNEKAFDELVKRYQPRLYNYLFRYTRNHEDTEDLVQETLFRVYRSRNAYERIARFSTWIFTIAGNLMRTQYRKKSRMVTWSINQDQTEESATISIPDHGLNPEEEAHSVMVLNLVNKAFNAMPEEYSQLLNLREIREMTYEEIASAVNLPMGTVKSRINRGRSKMQNVMRNMDDEALIYAA